MTPQEQIKDDLRLSKKRFNHTLGVAACARELAERHYPELDPDRIEIAALLHDMTKELSHEEQKELCEKYSIFISRDEEHVHKLYHAKTASAIARYEYNLDDDLVSAIYYHTTGKANMTDAQTVLYFADYIEENREDETCVDVRNFYFKALKNEKHHLLALKKSVLYSLDKTIYHLLEKGDYIDINTLQARNSILDELRDWE